MRDAILFVCAIAIVIAAIGIVVKVAQLNPDINRWKR
jgi:hypothetical protein